MQMDLEWLKELTEELIKNNELLLDDIPDIALYAEQLTGLMDARLKDSRRDPDEKILTRTMINNYTKAGVLMPPVNKKYSKDHIILLTLIYQLKSVLALSDIKRLFTPVLNNIAIRDDDLLPLEDIYQTFLDLKEQELSCLYERTLEQARAIRSRTEGLSPQQTETADLFLLVIMLAAQASAHKRLAERIIDRAFRTEPLS